MMVKTPAGANPFYLHFIAFLPSLLQANKHEREPIKLVRIELINSFSIFYKSASHLPLPSVRFTPAHETNLEDEQLSSNPWKQEILQRERLRY